MANAWFLFQSISILVEAGANIEGMWFRDFKEAELMASVCSKFQNDLAFFFGAILTH